MRIAFIGLGNMGAPMAGNLVKAGHAVAGFDLSPAAMAEGARRGVTLAPDLASAVAGAEVVITMLPSAKAVLTLAEALLPLVAERALVIDCSTIDVATARAVHDMFQGRCDTLDAPVSGGTQGAEAGSLTFMCGGAEAAHKRAAEVLAPMAGRVVVCGGAGNGQAAKICNNMILGISMIAVSEAFVLGEKLGLSHQALFDVASTSSGQCWSLTTYCPVPGPVPNAPSNRDYRPGFAAALMLKDLTLAQEAAAGVSATTPLGKAAAQLYADFVAEDREGRDFSAIFTSLRDV